MPHVDPALCLEQPQRRFLYDQIRGRPGRTLSDLIRASGLNSSTVLWHTQKLEQAGLVLSESHLGMRLYHAAANGLPGKRLGRATALLQDRRSRDVLELANSGATDVEAICRALQTDRRRVVEIIQALHVTQASQPS